MKKLTQEYVKLVLNYDPETGFLKKKKTRRTDWIGKKAGCIGSGGYRVVNIHNIHYSAHRLAWLWMTGDDPEEIDHINGNRDDNRFCNLRAASLTENRRNSKMKSTNKSGYKGVCWGKQHNKWRSTITVNRRHIHLGLFNCPTAAHIAYCNAARKLHGEFARFE